LASRSELPLSAADLAAKAAAEGRCPAIVVVAPNAEAVHDHIDGIVEAGEALDTVTTFHRAEELEDALVMLDAGLVGQGPVYAFSDSISFLETGLRELGLLS